MHSKNRGRHHAKATCHQIASTWTPTRHGARQQQVAIVDGEHRPGIMTMADYMKQRNQGM